MTEFEEIQEYCDVKPHKISQTRSLALEGLINRIIEKCESLKLYFISGRLEVNGIHASNFAAMMNPEANVCPFI